MGNKLGKKSSKEKRERKKQMKGTYSLKHGATNSHGCFRDSSVLFNMSLLPLVKRVEPTFLSKTATSGY